MRFCGRPSTFGGPATGVTYANWTGARALRVAGLSFARRGRAPTDVTASARSHRQVISRARPTEFPCSLWNALGRAKSMKTGILRRDIKNSPTDEDQKVMSPTGINSSPSAAEAVTLRFLGVYGLSDLWKPLRRIRNTQGEPNASLQL